MGVRGNLKALIDSLIPEEEKFSNEHLYRMSFLRVALLGSLSLIGAGASLIYAFVDVFEGDLIVSMFETVVAIALILNPVIARRYKNFNVMALISISLFSLVLFSAVFDELPEDKSSLVWMTAIPPVVFLAFGRKGLFFSAGFLILHFFLVLINPEVSLSMLIDTYFSFSLITVILYFYAWMSETYRDVWSGLAKTDSLTGIMNRPAFEEVLSKEIKRSKRYRMPISLILFDIDDFKALNDRYGHLFGDKILRRITTVVKDSIRGTDIFARWGGEEFVVLLPNTTLTETLNVAEKLRKKIQSVGMGSKVSVTASFGVTEVEDGDDAFRVILKADKALYIAKTNGKNRVEVFPS